MSNVVDGVGKHASWTSRARGDNTGNGNPPGGDILEARIARLESDVGHVKQDLSDIKTDIRDLRGELRTDIRLLLGAMVVTAVGLAGLMAKGFGWV